MSKTILVTGGTDGIGLETARILVARGHRVLLHGRSGAKLRRTLDHLVELGGDDSVEGHLADLSAMAEAYRLGETIAKREGRLDVVINNAGVYGAPTPVTDDRLDVRFAVNTVAPYLITQHLMAALGETGRIVNVSSAAQSTVDLSALRGEARLSDGAAYAQSKLALTAWTRALGLRCGGTPSVVSVNPGSLLGTKMVMEAFGHARAPVRVGADILVRASLEDDFLGRSGEYFDNDIGRFASPHPDVDDPRTREEILEALASVAGRATPPIL